MLGQSLNPTHIRDSAHQMICGNRNRTTQLEKALSALRFGFFSILEASSPGAQSPRRINDSRSTHLYPEEAFDDAVGLRALGIRGFDGIKHDGQRLVGVWPAQLVLQTSGD